MTYEEAAKKAGGFEEFCDLCILAPTKANRNLFYDLRTKIQADKAMKAADQMFGV